MANTVQIKRGNNTSVNAHTGPSGELIYNLDTGRLHAQDGSTAGGNPHALVSDVDLKANAATQVIAGDGLTGGGTLAASRTLALNSTSIASLAKADTAVQSINGKSGSAVSLVKGDVGLGNVDNTSDLAKPISTLTQTALNAKANSAITVSAGTGLTGGGNLTSNRTVALNTASIASLGKADTALQAPGGTTGQILAKSSATDNDVAWVSSEAATAVSYGPQVLTEPQKVQARANIDAETSYDTKAAAEAANIPSSVNAIRLNGYYAAGDGGASLYKRVASEPSHAGKVQSADGAWWEEVTIKTGGTFITGVKIPTIVNSLVLADQDGMLTQWGNPQHINLQLGRGVGDGASNTALLGAAIDSLTVSGGGVIKLTAGKFPIDNSIVKTLSNNGSIVIEGAGIYATQLVWTGEAGGFYITYPDDGFWVPQGGASFSAANLSMLATSAGTSHAFSINGKSYPGRPMLRTSFTNVFVGGDTAGGNDFWSVGWYYDSVCNVTMTDVDYTGKQSEATNTMMYLTATGLPGGGCFEHTYKGLRGVYCALVMGISGDGVEGIILNGGHFTGCTSGVRVDDRALQLVISNTHFACTGMPLNLKNSENFVLRDSLIFTNTADATALQNEGGGLSHISGNTFIANAGGGIGMVLASRNDAGPSIISENTTVGYAVGIQLQPGSAEYMIGHNRTAGVATPINDLSTPGSNVIY